MKTRILGAVALVAVVAASVNALFIVPADLNQGDAQRIMYVHVPSAWLAYLAFIVTAVASGIYLLSKRHSLGWDRLAGASAEVGVLFMGVTLVVNVPQRMLFFRTGEGVLGFPVAVVLSWAS